MNKRYIAALLGAAMTFCALNAQTWTLDSCITYAVKHNLTVKSRELSTVSGELDITEAKDRFLPTVSAGATQSFSFGRGLTAENTYANRNTSNFSASAGLNLPLFQGLRNVRNLEYAKANMRTLVQQLESAKDDITLNVIAQYLQTLYYDEMRKVALEQQRLSETELKRREELLAAGKIAELDVIQAKSQLAQDEYSTVTAQNNYDLAIVDLCQLLELESTEGFAIAPVDTEQPMPLLDAERVYEAALQTNHSILASRYGVESASKAVSLAKSGWLPTLSFNAGIGSNYYTTSGYKSEGFGRQMRHNFSKSLGFSLNIPIFDAFSTRNAVRKARVQELNAKLQLSDTRNRIYKAIQQAYTQAVAADKRKASSAVACSATEAALEAMRLKYDYGKANATEFEQAKTAYIKAVSDAVQAKYESVLRKRILAFYYGTSVR
ncbi:MAG: TolC family protein [Muribaculaceae bacterium]|nr:TolC family protein [Muribaculaceae bacterium]